MLLPPRKFLDDGDLPQRSALGIVLGLKKPLPYWKAREILESRGYSAQTAATCLVDNAVNTLSGIQTAKGDYYIQDGVLFPYKPEMDLRIFPESINTDITRKRELIGKTLLVFPCNSGAFHGDYFRGRTWRNAALYFPERMSSLDFAATDSIISVRDDGKGLLVFENEMDRVRGLDLYPSFSEEKLSKCKELAKASVDRLSAYKHIILVLNVRLYREAMETIADDRFHFIDCPYKQGAFVGALKSARTTLSNL